MADPCIVISGASKDIGAAMALELERRGFDIVGLSRSGDSAAGDGRVCDVTDEKSVKDALARVAETRSITGLINNAGLHLSGHSATFSTADYEQVMAINATAVMVMSREAYPYLKKTGGKIINMGSFFDKLGVPDNLAYCASKAAVAAMTRCLAVEWAGDGIQVVNVAPGYIETDLNRDFLARDKVRQWITSRIPTGDVGRPEEVARLVGALFTEDLPFLTGETIYMDGGQGMNH